MFLENSLFVKMFEFLFNPEVGVFHLRINWLSNLQDYTVNKMKKKKLEKSNKMNTKILPTNYTLYSLVSLFNGMSTFVVYLRPMIFL